MDLTHSIKEISNRAKKLKANVETEEATKNAFVMPFLNALGYDVFNPEVVIPEFIADIGIKKGEKVDYAIKIDQKVTILIECKPCNTNLANAHYSQLFRYFTVTDAKFAILTNGIEYWFFSDLEEKNRMDKVPFFQFNLLDHSSSAINELKKFIREGFDLDNILNTATNLKYGSAIKKVFIEEIENPSEDFVKFFVSKVYDGRFTKGVKEEFEHIVSKSLKDAIKELINKRLTDALDSQYDEAEETEAEKETTNNDGVETTEEEKEAFHIVKSIIREVIPADRIFMRDIVICITEPLPSEGR